MRYALPLLVAVVLIGVAIGRAHPAGQACVEAEALHKAGGASGSAILTKKASEDFSGLLEHATPACAIKGLAQGAGGVRSTRNVPQKVSGLDRWRAYLANLRLDTTEWILLTVAFLLLVRVVLTFFISRRPGAVNLGSVTDADSKDAADDAIAARIHQRLTSQRLFGTPLVPGGGLPEAVATTLKEVEVPEAKSLAALVRAVTTLIPRSGVNIDAVLRTRDARPDQHGCTVTLTDVSTGRVMEVFTEWNKTAGEAADAAAACVIAYVLDRDPVRRRTPAWSRFGGRGQEALAALTRGDDCGSDDLLEAREHYEEALSNNPANLTIAMRLGEAYEAPAVARASDPEKAEIVRARQAAVAARVYLRASQLWPEAYAPRYRAVVALTMCERRASELDELRKLGLNSSKKCRAAANDLLDALVRDLCWRAVFKRWLRTYYLPSARASGTRRYFQRFINPLSLERVRLRTAYKMAKPAIEGSTKHSKASAARVRTLLGETSRAPAIKAFKRLRVNWQVRYIAACFYARRAVTDKNSTDDHLKAANELLREVLTDPRHGVDRKWLGLDPDLEPLREWESSNWQELEVLGRVAEPATQRALASELVP